MVFRHKSGFFGPQPLEGQKTEIQEEADQKMSRIVIDAFNLIHASSFPQIRGDDEVESLVEMLRRYKQLKGHTITTVIDGYLEGMPVERSERVKGISLIYSKLGEKADQVIERLADRWGGSCVVITSDRALAEAVEARGAVVMGSEEFAERLRMVEYLEIKGAEVEESCERPMHTRKKGNPKKKSKRERRRARSLKKL